ncbi:MAG: hypothetical protein AAGK47_08510, partial [Bacteroidota bacterium]
MIASRIYYLLSALLTYFLLHSCYPQEPPAIKAVHEQQAWDSENLDDEPSTYEIRWGDIRLPLEKYASPNGFKGEVTIEHSLFLEAIDQPIELYYNNLPQPFEWYKMYHDTHTWRSSDWYPNPAEDHRNLAADIVDKLRTKTQKGDQIRLHIGAEDNSVQVVGAVIRIADAYESYKPEKTVVWSRVGKESFGFQVVSQEGREGVLRIDTTAAETASVYNMYKKRKDYKIMHIPRFETQRRLVIDEDEIFDKREVRRTELLQHDYDRWTLTEFTDYYNRSISLHWGSMKSYANSEIYPLTTFSKSYEQPLELHLDERKLPILGFEVVIKNGEASPIRFITDSLNNAVIQEIFADLKPRSSVYFTHLIVEDEDIIKYFPLSFAFHLDDPLPFDLDIAEVTGEDIEKPAYNACFSDGLYQITYRNYRLSDMIAALTDLDAEEIFFINFDDNPVVNVCFSSPDLSLDYGKRAIQRALRKEYNILLNWSWYDYYQLNVV